MGTKTIYECDNCGKATDRPTTCKGWIKVNSTDGSACNIARSRGERNNNWDSSWDIIHNESHDFCSIECLVDSLDKKADRAPTRVSAAPVFSDA
jgi:hypothetical protein